MPDDLAPNEAALLAEAEAIIALAKELQADGQDMRAVELANHANLRLHAIRSLQRMRAAVAEYNSTKQSRCRLKPTSLSPIAKP